MDTTEAGTETTTEKKVKDKPNQTYFITDKYADKGTVYGALRVIVHSKGETGCPGDVLLAEMLETFKPKKSAKFGPSYISSYMRDAPKRGFLTTDPAKRAESLGEPTVRTREVDPDAPKKASSLMPSEAGLNFLLGVINHLSIPEFSESNPGITLEDLAKKLEKPVLTLTRVAGALAKKGHIVMDGQTVSLTKTAYDSIDEAKAFYNEKKASKAASSEAA